MKACLNCQKSYQSKRDTSKFCSDKCRVAYNRKHPQAGVSKFQMQVLYNNILAAVDSINAKNGQPEAFAGVLKTDRVKGSNISADPKEPNFKELMNGMANIHFADEKDEYAQKIRSNKTISEKERQILLSSLFYKS